ncbi:hypothetical protein BDV96DRAFT_635645 [Lophiotrema nucula]|uniref:DUF7730 domain-containing protein n=1 Tax=Lophiotrema nucula TaxID=690887 RepID=A0A6A5YSK9_9PLEO|nr:hypothetical protein BDV96DRAFT_635645 [Lophiotrema nucula]
MSNNKRTYSRRSMSRMPDDGGSPSDNQKKRKTAPPAKANRFSGPTTIPSDEEVSSSTTKPSFLDKFRKPGAGSAFQPQDTLNRNLYGNGSEAFRKSIPSHQPQAEEDRKHGKKSSIVPGYRLGTTSGVMKDIKSNTGKLFANILSHPSFSRSPPNPGPEPRPKEQYVPKKYLADPALTPTRDTLKRSLPAASAEAQIWKENQTNSPLLRLPAEVRNTIYDYVYNRKTIFIEFDTYKRVTVERAGTEVEQTVPVFKYYRTVFGRLANPLREPFNPDLIPQEQGFFNRLSPVCRQLYEETATLPYLNRWVFDSHITMLNFLCLGPKLRSCQLDAIEQLVTPEELPDNCILNRLGGLKNVWIHGRRSGNSYPVPGWYDVEVGDDYRVLVKRTP